MAFIDWQDKYSVGIAEVDAQHRRLVELINGLHDAVEANRPREVLGTVFEELIQYTVTHFTYEENLFSEYDYPDKAEHTHQHQVLKDKVLLLKKEHEHGKAALSQPMLKFLQAWLVEHIQGADQRYGRYLVGKGVS